MIEEAAELYAKCGRYDQLNLLHQACGQWEQAVEVTARREVACWSRWHERRVVAQK